MVIQLSFNMLIYANKRENGAADMFFFFSPKNAWLIFRQLQQRREKDLYPFKTGGAKNEMLGQSGPPLCT